MQDAAPASATLIRSFEHWHQVTCHNYSNTDWRVAKGARFEGRLQVRSFGPLAISHSAVYSADADHPIHITRNAAHIRKDGRDDFLLWLTSSGTATISQDGRAARMGAGDLVFYDQTQPFSLAFDDIHHAIMLTIPRALLVSRMPTARRCVARRIAAGTPIGALAASVIEQLGRMEPDTDTDVAQRLGASALDILATTMAAELNQQESPLPQRARQCEQVKRYLLANLEDSSLDLERIAKCQNMAPRTLNRLFAAEGTTPIRWLWRQRLAASYKALAEGHVTQVIDAALSFGFSDPSHFSRAFKAEFGRSPQAVTRQRHTQPEDDEN